MELPGFLPEELRQLARFVPARGWDAVEWRPMLASLRSVSWRFVSGTGVRALSRQTQAVVDRLVLAPPPAGGNRAGRPGSRRATAQRR